MTLYDYFSVHRVYKLTSMTDRTCLGKDFYGNMCGMSRLQFIRHWAQGHQDDAIVVLQLGYSQSNREEEVSRD